MKRCWSTQRERTSSERARPARRRRISIGGIDGRAIPLEHVQKIAEFRAQLRRFLSQTERIGRRWGLTPQRYLLLLSIKGAADGSQRARLSDLAERLQVAPNTVTELAARAEEARLVRRQEDAADRRVVYLRLTADGERRLQGALIESEEYRRELAEAFALLAKTFRRT